MVKVGKFFAYSLFFILALIYLTPKASVYHFFEEQLKPYSIVLNNESVTESLLGLDITDGILFVQSVEAAEIKSIEVNLFVLFNAIDIKGITLSSLASTLLPLSIQEVHIRYSILNPLTLTFDGEAEAGAFHASFHLLERLLYVTLKPSDDMLKNYRSTLSNMKQSENGEYVYEKTI